jgi:hypothetical protein
VLTRLIDTPIVQGYGIETGQFVSIFWFEDKKYGKSSNHMERFITANSSDSPSMDWPGMYSPLYDCRMYPSSTDNQRLAN